MELNVLTSTPDVSFLGKRVPLRASRNLSVSIVCMPWSSIAFPSIALGILKKCVEGVGCTPKLHYMNLRFAKFLGIEKYERISMRSHIYPEWFFSPALFGEEGTGEMRNGWDDLVRNPNAARMREELIKAAGDDEELCRDLSERIIPEFIQACIDETDWSQCDVVGFTSTFAQSLSSLLMAKKIREVNPRIKIVLGGANVDHEMGVEFMSAFEWIDYVVHGEGEESFQELLCNIANGDDFAAIPGVSVRSPKGILRGDQSPRPSINMNDSPSPDYEDYIAELGSLGHVDKTDFRLFYESSRGCWWGKKHHCTFCGLNGSTMDYRQKDADVVYDQIMELAKKYKCLNLAAADNILANDYFTKLLPRLADSNIDLSLFYEVKANLRRDQLELLARAGVKLIQPGIESFSSRLLKLMNKGVTAIQNVQLLKWCFECEIRPSWNLLSGFPGERDEDYADLANTFRLISHLQPPESLSEVLFERFSPYHFDRDRYKLTIWPYHSYQFIYPQDRVNFEKIAYFFEGSWEERPSAPETYLAEAKAVRKIWAEGWMQARIFCYYEKGPDYLCIHDSRPRLPSDLSERRKIHLNRQLRELYLFCDEHRSFQSIVAMAQQHLPELDESTLREKMESLVAHRLMFKEGDRYLSLATRRKPAQSRSVS